MLIENVSLISRKYPELWKSLKIFESVFESGSTVVEVAKNNHPTLKYESNSKKLYIHSKYDPVMEAESFVKQFDDIHSYKHIFFYGLGMGYHINAFLKYYPDMKFTIYEPSPEIFYRFLETRLLSDLPLKELQHLYIEWDKEVVTFCLNHFLQNVNEKTMLIMHPVYERINIDKVQDFKERFKKAVTDQMNSIGVNARFERLWTMNCLSNFPVVIETPHIIREKRQELEDMPVLLVAAGPSLVDELENIKYIKNNGLAYIFSVGSAIKALLNYGIEPDAVFAYDPETGLEGLDTFGGIVENKISTIPLIFGSTVGANTVKRYTGPMMHAFITQDTVSSYYLGEHQVKELNGLISDAPSIALVALEIVAKLGCSPIILVGQNLAFRNNQYYASGIEYASRPNELSELEKKNLITVKSVDGDEVYTSASHNVTRVTMENYIKQINSVIINTTKGGASIEGAKYSTLENVIADKLTSKVVRADWFVSGKTNYNLSDIGSKINFMEKEHQSLNKTIDDVVQVMRTMDKLTKSKNIKGLEKQYPVFDKLFKKLQKNLFFVVYIHPMVRLQQQILHRFIADIRNTDDPYLKAKKLIDNFGKFIFECKVEMELIVPEVIKMHSHLSNLYLRKN
ncbi:motility associated factor glycosyltransferase family protein [Paenibacillus sp. YYML68]|uniref:motility associated factor glycosyltransferase family protein n=1 Tax=Paenibacillus sp. YYML68 TaxID=2909250 RepID=UPI002493B514|nr:6-hydroxymethylpterin diphosphokinase MptE-like protein [Paenibacillus sp. YYML68]